MIPNNLYVNGISMTDISTILIDKNNPARTKEIWLDIISTAVGIIIMSQIRLSLSELNMEYIDKLPSYRRYKKAFILGRGGRTLATAVGLVLVFPYIHESNARMGEEEIKNIIGETAIGLVSAPITNAKRLSKPSSPDNWMEYLEGEISSSFGQILSCPGTNLRLLNLPAAGVINADLNYALYMIGITDQILNDTFITREEIIQKIMILIMEDLGGIPKLSITYEENPQVNSRIELEIMGNRIQRRGMVNTHLSKGMEPHSTITKNIAQKYLSKLEFLSYNTAIRSGNTEILRKYTNLISERIKDENSQSTQDYHPNYEDTPTFDEDGNIIP